MSGKIPKHTDEIFQLTIDIMNEVVQDIPESIKDRLYKGICEELKKKKSKSKLSIMASCFNGNSVFVQSKVHQLPDPPI